jgi:hypothetical protein
MESVKKNLGGLPVSALLVRLGSFEPETIISEKALAEMARKCHETIRRWRRKGYLPAAVKMGADLIWTARAIIAHVEMLLEKAAQERIAFLARVGGRMPGQIGGR